MSNDAVETVLIIDDEPNIVELARLYLEREGFKVISASKGRDGLDLISASAPNLVILDVMLPDIDGLEVLKRLRKSSKVPVLMLSARREDVDKIIGLEMGADDYLTKPFNPHELLARVKAILRRSQHAPSREDVIELGNLKINAECYETTVAGTKITLRTKEFALLLAMAKQPGVVFSREKLLNQVWGYDFYGDTRTVDVHVNHLRDKLAGSNADIETLRGAGYKLVVRDGPA
jgi:DNA-binding response OmpR family regulator